ncbi:helix-turn-helix transcriptional regulator [Agrobacterium tumefaciens]|uniref:helix-turn-helix transcriptional regulator n=1 Tax=Agrobacterium tumefaciens TaxID=358 RepID=UPI00287CEDE2|nr:helix-turn-helix transcriptional regulator [Agrobacterium tumefaciens]MDS7595409.1 helix-turn-helix transcriptional regulator [Agrobacterium tumefaciens]
MSVEGIHMERFVGATHVSRRGGELSSRSRFDAVRLTSPGLGSEMTSPIPIEQTYIVSIQLQRIGRHELWKGGKLSNSLPYERHSVNIVHLAEEPTILLPDPFDCLQLHVPEHALKDYAESNHSHQVEGFDIKPGEINLVLANLAQALVPALSDKTPSSGLFIDQLFFAMVSELVAAYGRKAWRPAHLTLSQSQLSLAKEMLSAEDASSLGLGDIARECGIPVEAFSSAFRAATGLTPSQWARRYRVEKVQTLLQSTTLSMKQIARLCGFADQAHLTRTFSTLVGMTPSAWRRNR